MVTSIYQEVELSLTENLIPVTVPVKQYDNKARKVRCVLYNNSVQYSVPQDCIVACSGTRPDGTIFHYISETATDLVFVENGAVVFTITAFMTAQAGRFPLDVVMLSTAGDVLGSFSLTLKVERAAINNGKIATYTYAGVVEAIRKGLLQDAISHQVTALREAALEQNVELNEALSNGEVTIDDIDLDIRSGLTPGSIGVSFYGTETEEGSEAQIYTELVNDLQERLKTLQQERQTIEEEQGVLAIMKKNFEYFLACLKELPDTNAGGMPLRVNGLDVQGTLLRDVDGKPIEGRKRAITSGKLKLTPERIAEAPDMLHFEKGIYCAFVESGVLQGDVATYKTNFGVTLTSKGNRRTLDSFMGYKRSDMDGNVVYVDAPYKVYGFSIQYRRYLTTAAKREREEAV